MFSTDQIQTPIEILEELAGSGLGYLTLLQSVDIVGSTGKLGPNPDVGQSHPQ